MQELYQKKYISQKPEYEFDSGDNGMMTWYCEVTIGDDIDTGFVAGRSKTEAKKRASFLALLRLFEGSGIVKDEWYAEYDETEPDDDYDPYQGKRDEFHKFANEVVSVY